MLQTNWKKQISDSEMLYERVISLDSDSCLDGHRLASLPVFPFVLGLEYACQFLESSLKETKTLCMENFCSKSMLYLFKDRPKTVNIRTKKEAFGHRFILFYDDQIYMEGSLGKSFKFSEKPDIPAPVYSHKVTNGIYEQVLPHGLFFHVKSLIGTLNPDFACGTVAPYENDLKYLDDLNGNDLYLNIPLIDGLFQMVALHQSYYSKTILLPSKFEKLIVDFDQIKGNHERNFILKRVEDKVFDLYLIDGEKIILEISKMRFEELKRHERVRNEFQHNIIKHVQKGKLT